MSEVSEAGGAVVATRDSQLFEVVGSDDGVLGLQRAAGVHLAEDLFAQSFLAVGGVRRGKDQQTFKGGACHEAHIWNILTSAPVFSRPA